MKKKLLEEWNETMRYSNEIADGLTKSGMTRKQSMGLIAATTIVSSQVLFNNIDLAFSIPYWYRLNNLDNIHTGENTSSEQGKYDIHTYTERQSNIIIKKLSDAFKETGESQTFNNNLFAQIIYMGLIYNATKWEEEQGTENFHFLSRIFFINFYISLQSEELKEMFFPHGLKHFLQNEINKKNKKGIVYDPGRSMIKPMLDPVLYAVKRVRETVRRCFPNCKAKLLMPYIFFPTYYAEGADDVPSTLCNLDTKLNSFASALKMTGEVALYGKQKERSEKIFNDVILSEDIIESCFMHGDKDMLHNAIHGCITLLSIRNNLNKFNISVNFLNFISKYMEERADDIMESFYSQAKERIKGESEPEIDIQFYIKHIFLTSLLEPQDLRNYEDPFGHFDRLKNKLTQLSPHGNLEFINYTRNTIAAFQPDETVRQLLKPIAESFGLTINNFIYLKKLLMGIQLLELDSSSGIKKFAVVQEDGKIFAINFIAHTITNLLEYDYEFSMAGY